VTAPRRVATDARRRAKHLARSAKPMADTIPISDAPVTARSAALALVSPATVLASLEESVHRAKAYAGEAKASNTRRAYEADQRTFRTWCEARGLSALPATPATVAVYLAALADQGRKVSTIERALSGIVAAQRAHGVAWPKGHPQVREVLTGIRRRLGVAPARKAPVGDEELAALVNSLGEDVAGLRDRALLTLGWSGAFRRSELVALDVADIAFQREGLVVTLRRSKTDQEGKGTEKGIPFAGAPALCPVRALRAYLDTAGVADGAVFRAVVRGELGARLGGRAVARIVQRSARLAGLDPTRYAGHSLRAGFVTTAAKKGKSLDAIMRQTGHRSERVARGYIRHATIFDDNAATGLV
jgi:site-specific recombinase XerD